MRSLDLRIPPVVVVVITAILMWIVSGATPGFRFALPSRVLVATAFGLAGVILSGLGVLSFRHARTTVNPRKPGASSSLVQTGVYRFTRNPMYLGFLLVLAGWAIFLSSAVAILLIPAFMLYMNRFQIEPEERALTTLFGQDFLDYKSRVRRWA